MKKGISLIVLVITIIIIIILAGAVILNLSSNNPVDNANKAAVQQEEADFRSGVALWISDIVADTLQNPTITIPSAKTLASASYVGTDGQAIPSGYADLAEVTVTSTVVAEDGTETPTNYKGYDAICGAVEMTPSKAGTTKAYKIAMNEAGNIIFYKAK